MRKVTAGAVVLVLLCLAWAGAWLVLARVAGARANSWIASEASQGRTWTCPDRGIGGFPFAVTLSCTDPTYAGEALGQAVQGSLGRVVAAVTLAHPFRLALTLGSPFAYQTSDRRTDVTGTWTDLRADVDGMPDPRVLTLAGAGVRLDGLFGQAGRQRIEAEALSTRFALAGSSSDRAVEFRIAVRGAPSQTLDAIFGDRRPIDADLVGRIDHASIADAKTPEDAMEQWRRQGGTIDLAPSRLTRGDAAILASGTLGLDTAHRPRGRLAAQFVGLEPMLRRYGISGNLAAAGSLLSTLFGGGPKPDAPRVPGALSLPIGLADGQVSIGPIRTGIVVPALY